MGKKGAVEVQFNWIFVLIAGALVLMLITGFVFRWMRSAGSEVSAESLRNIETLITATGTVEGETRLIDIPRVSMGYDCMRLSFGDASIGSVQTGNLFAPRLIRGDRLIIWTKGLFLPFYSGNAVFIAPDAARYIVVANATTKTLNKSLAEGLSNLNVHFTDSAGYLMLADENNYHAVVVFLGELQSPPPYFRQAPKAIKVRAHEGNVSGTLEFYTSSGSAWVPAGLSEWTGEVMLTGAVVSGEHDIYQCVRGNLMERWSIVATLLLHKLDILIAEHPAESTYAGFRDTLEDGVQSVERDSYSAHEFMNKVARLQRSNTVLSYKGVPAVY
jgi:hypothetical protein